MYARDEHESGASEWGHLLLFHALQTKIVGVELGPGIERRAVAVQCDVLPQKLIRLAAELGLSIAITQYPAAV
jgi:hypothetical protein